MDKLRYGGPVVLAILDGVGLAPDSPGNAVSKARTAFLGEATKKYLHMALDAFGESVGLLPGQMGNSEVGHNAMGAGKIIKQDIARINEAFATGEVFDSEAWRGAMQRLKSTNNIDNSDKVLYNGGIAPATLHFAGIFSDGGVHSHFDHLEQMIAQAYREGVRHIRVHAMLDGRDTPPQSEPKYIRRFENFAKQFPDADIKIASGGGRQTTTCDRYENDWSMVKRGFDMMVYGQAEYYFQSAEEAILAFRQEDPNIQDQDLPAFVVVDAERKPVGKIKKGDVLIYFDFRKDRAIEIAEAFTYWDFPYFDRGDYSPVDVYFVGLTEYNSDTHVPEHRLIQPMDITETLNQFLGDRGISDLAVSETIKFGHITYYFNGNSYEKANGEEFIKVDTYEGSPTDKPWMRSADIADVVIENMANYDFVRLNFPNGDVVGHTADMEATIVAMEAVDIALSRIAKEVDKLGGVLVIVADHGCAEELLDAEGNKLTAHTTNKVPFIIYDNTANRGKYRLNNLANPGLSNLAATMAILLGQNDYPKGWNAPLITLDTNLSDLASQDRDIMGA